MAEKKAVGHAYNIDFLNVVFAASSIFLFVTTIWMVWDDFDREWKNTQRAFTQLDSGRGDANSSRRTLAASIRQSSPRYSSSLRLRRRRRTATASASTRSTTGSRRSMHVCIAPTRRRSSPKPPTTSTATPLKKSGRTILRASAKSRRRSRPRPSGERANLEVQEVEAERAVRSAGDRRYTRTSRGCRQEIDLINFEQTCGSVVATSHPACQGHYFRNAPAARLHGADADASRSSRRTSWTMWLARVTKRSLTTCHLGDPTPAATEKYPQPFRTIRPVGVRRQ